MWGTSEGSKSLILSRESRRSSFAFDLSSLLNLALPGLDHRILLQSFI